MLVLFLVWATLPVKLHSFPTRRSSDLGDGDAATARTRAEEALALARELGARSEEHTSELQSHSDLVCRLLLEKKKGVGDPAAPERRRPHDRRAWIGRVSEPGRSRRCP